MTYLRDFLYLDNAKLYSFVSQIQGGMIGEISETMKQSGGLSARVNVGISSIGGKVDTGKQKESERKQNITLTDPAYFEVLYQYLKKDELLIDISNKSINKILDLPVGQFIEMNGIAEPPLVENWLERLTSLYDFFEKNFMMINKVQGNTKGKSSYNFSRGNLQQYKLTTNLLIDYINLVRKDPRKQYIRIISEDQKFRVWCGLIPDYALVSLHSTLPAKVQVLGRIDHLVKEGETEKIVDLSKFQRQAQLNGLLEILNNLGRQMGQTSYISESDLEAKYPDIFIAPVAIYQ
jgi:hypothetical protein